MCHLYLTLSDFHNVGFVWHKMNFVPKKSNESKDKNFQKIKDTKKVKVT